MSFGTLPPFDSSHPPSILLALSGTMEELDKTYFFAERELQDLVPILKCSPSLSSFSPCHRTGGPS